jgi:hypothetical protein
MARLQPDVAEHILREAPTLSETLLNGLGTWRNIYNYIYIYYTLLSKEVGKQYFRVTDK